MRRLYLVIGWAIVLLGAAHLFATTRPFDGLTQNALRFFSTGFAVSLTGALNLLNRSYGAEAPGLRMVCLAANLVMTCYAALAGAVGDATVMQVLVVGLYLVATMLSILAVLMPPEEPQERSETQPRVTWPGFGSRVRHPLRQKPRDTKP